MANGLYRGIVNLGLGEPPEAVSAHRVELAGSEARSGTLTEASNREQSQAGLGLLDEARRAELAALNHQYRERFGFPFIICARLNSRDAIFGTLRARLTNARDQELQNALAQVAQIARLRLMDILAQP